MVSPKNADDVSGADESALPESSENVRYVVTALGYQALADAKAFTGFGPCAASCSGPVGDAGGNDPAAAAGRRRLRRAQPASLFR